MIGVSERVRRMFLPALAAAFVTAWILGTTVTIATSGERGAQTEQSLYSRASAALREGDPAAFGELLLDGADSEFAADYVERLTAAGRPELVRTGPDTADIRSGRLVTTLSVTREQERWYLSLLPAGG